MARAIIRALPLYIDGLKVAEVSNGTYDIATGDEIQIATDGVMGLSDGAATTNMSFNTIVPVIGMKAKVDDMLINKKYIDIGIPVNGAFHTCTGRLVTGSYSWDHKNGTCTGAFTFNGGPPTKTG